MTRATPMPPEERRASLVEATLPLLLTHGTALTTKQVAEAAGVAEGTIFRVFDSLGSLIDATTLEALSATRLQRDIAAVEPGTTLESVTATAIGLLTRRMGDIRTLLHTVHMRTRPAEGSPGFDTTASPRTSGSGRLNQREGDGLNQRDGGDCLRDELEARRHELDGWVAAQLEPFVDELAIEPHRYVEFLRTLALGHVFAHGETRLTPEQLAQLALQGARKAR